MSGNTDTEAWVEGFLTELFDRAGFDLSIEEMYIDDEDVLRIQIAGEDSARAIGRNGQVLDALQQIAVAAAIRAKMDGRRIFLDIEGYRERRESRLRDDALRIAVEVQKDGEVRELAPMSPRERRLVHLVVADIEGVTTQSVGDGEERFVQVLPRSGT